MKRPFFTGVLLPMTMMMLASCSSCSTSDDDPTPAPPKSKCIVAGYSNAGALSSVSPADYPDMKYPTRVYCFGISPDTEGAWFVDTQREQRQNAVRAAMNSSQEAFLVVGGGATAGNMYRMGTDPAKRAAFAEALVKYAHERDFDGIDVDWETDWSEEPFLHVPEDDMVALLSEIRERMSELPAGTKLRQLTAALSSGTLGQSMGGRIVDYVDHINVMIYDTYGTEEEGYPHAPMRIVESTLAGYAAEGVPNSKIIVGVPFYGGNKQATPVATQSYRTLCAMAGGAITASSNSYAGYAFNGVDLMKEKTQYVLDHGYAGIVIWELSQDLPYKEPLSLLRAIKSVADEQ
ncbi:MAG TPA: glycoside hydrolase family 18 protein [Candidatus Alistipes intestinipullorum]|nr:glycoside hydrolase family 18 protein [Candidatus Alistipes intestinipullorum]